MGRRLVPLVVLVLAALALPAGASAASKKVKVPRVADGNLSISQYDVRKKGKAPKARVLRKAGLGDRKVIATVHKVKRNRYRLTIMALNPQGGAGGGGGARAAAPPVVEVYGVGPVSVSERETIIDVLDAELPDEEAMEDFCDDEWGAGILTLRLALAGLPSAKARAVARAVRLYLCEEGDEDEIEGAYQTLDDLGLSAPSCFGHAKSFNGSAVELVVVLICMQQIQSLGVIGPQGSQGANCFSPHGFCSWGPICSFFDGVSAVCFQSSPMEAFPVGQSLTFNVRYDTEVIRNAVALLFARAIAVGAGPHDPAVKVWLDISAPR